MPGLLSELSDQVLKAETLESQPHLLTIHIHPLYPNATASHESLRKYLGARVPLTRPRKLEPQTSTSIIPNTSFPESIPRYCHPRRLGYSQLNCKSFASHVYRRMVPFCVWFDFFGFFFFVTFPSSWPRPRAGLTQMEPRESVRA